MDDTGAGIAETIYVSGEEREKSNKTITDDDQR